MCEQEDVASHTLSMILHKLQYVEMAKEPKSSFQRDLARKICRP